ncbi:MAG: InlB B-repeat-containing protein, partial [Roseburia sp.]|nr:InlB B-repeat-containing protein [Roseburia sp.]
MKKSKFVLATLAAAVFATSAAGLAACSKSTGGGDDEYTITFDANGSYFGSDTTTTTKEVETIAGLALQPTPASRSGYTFNGYTFTQDGTDTVASTNIFTDSITVYASWTSTGSGNGDSTGVVTVILDANGGTLGAVSSVQTNSSGQLAALPVAPTAPTTPAGQTFAGWYTAAQGGTLVDTDTVFTGTGNTIYAHWSNGSGDDDGPGNGNDDGNGNTGVTATGNDIYVGSTVKYNLTDNMSSVDTVLYETQDQEWMVLSQSFTAGEQISFKINSADITLSDVDGFGASAWSASSITIKNTASFNIYVKHWSDTGSWTVWITDGSADAVPDNGNGNDDGDTSTASVNGSPMSVNSG